MHLAPSLDPMSDICTNTEFSETEPEANVQAGSPKQPPASRPVGITHAANFQHAQTLVALARPCLRPNG